MNNLSNLGHRLVMLLGLLALSSGFVWGQAPPAVQGAPAPAAASPKPDTALPVDPKTYIIGAGDELKIEVFGQPELTRNVLVRTDGKITMLLLDDVQAEGLTPEQLKQRLIQGLTGPIAAPTVTVSLIGLNSKKYFINGQVNRPGTYFLTTPITVFDALNSAGGFATFANLNKILIVRGTKRLKFSYNNYLKGKNTGQNVYVEAGDTIYVK